MFSLDIVLNIRDIGVFILLLIEFIYPSMSFLMNIITLLPLQLIPLCRFLLRWLSFQIQNHGHVKKLCITISHVRKESMQHLTRTHVLIARYLTVTLPHYQVHLPHYKLQQLFHHKFQCHVLLFHHKLHLPFHSILQPILCLPKEIMPLYHLH